MKYCTCSFIYRRCITTRTGKYICHPTGCYKFAPVKCDHCQARLATKRKALNKIGRKPIGDKSKRKPVISHQFVLDF